MSEVQAAAEYAPPDCAICERSLLVGEAVQLFRNRDSRLVKVCELCRTRAQAKGFEAIALDQSPRMRVHASGSVRDVVDRDALIAGMGHELAFLKQQLGEAKAALVEQTVEEDTLRAITDKFRRQERELERLRKEADPIRLAQDRRTIQEQNLQIRELRAQLRDRDTQIERLANARIAETRPAVMCQHALDAFNSSEHADRMMRIARTLEEPQVSVNDMGPGLPRCVNITLVWDIAWYEFCVKLDLGAGKASVRETGNGGDPRVLDASRRAGNAQWRSSGLVMS